MEVQPVFSTSNQKTVINQVLFEIKISNNINNYQSLRTITSFVFLSATLLTFIFLLILKFHFLRN